MGYLFLATALFSGAAKGYCGKKMSGYIKAFNDSVMANIVRMLLCVVIGLVFIIAEKNLSNLNIGKEALLITALSGAGTSLFVVTWLISVKNGAYMMVDVFLMLGVIIPILGSLFLFGEQVRTNQWIGMTVLFLAVFLMCSYNNSIKGKMNIFSFAILLLCGVANGSADFSQKIFAKQFTDIPISVFNFYTYLFSAMVLVVFFIFSWRGSDEQQEKTNLKYVFIYIPIMSVFLFLNSYFKTKAAFYLDASQLYPLNQGASLVLSSVMAAVFFKEKMNVKSVVGIILSFAALMIMNLL